MSPAISCKQPVQFFHLACDVYPRRAIGFCLGKSLFQRTIGWLVLEHEFQVRIEEA